MQIRNKKNCLVCKKEFSCPTRKWLNQYLISQNTWSKREFCSHKCSNSINQLQATAKNKGKKQNKELIERRIAPLRGRARQKFSKQWIKNLSNSHLGQVAWNKDIKIPELSGDNHFAWKGEDVKYRGLHSWIERTLGKPNKCSACGKIGYGRQMHWANKGHVYKRNLTDWVRLCVKCHKAFDRNESVLLFK